ncbi:Rid family detoxifying hydrolase [uncultured Enterococcus sp.]|uniref:Rid family detoxifying hydrolase n=1 Tax=uncultured Enterococcus sp. TaxID=167972 RepID=UPI0025F30FAD|nr:Rid family detoxifying hydrolase [uncultured Enterococcus sp.]
MSEKLVQPVGPYSLVRRAGSLLFVSGQLGIDPQTNQLVGGVEKQLSTAIENVKRILASEGASLTDIVKTTVLLADMADFTTINELYAIYFSEPYPARSTYAVNTLPLNAKVEIEVIAMVSE